MIPLQYRLPLIALIAILLLPGCTEPVPGCTDPSSPNYDPQAGIDDGSCQYAVPEAYLFERREKNTVFPEEEVVRQLLINDLDLKIAALAEAGALPVTQAELLQYYEHEDAFNLGIRTPVGTGFTPLDSTFSAIASDTRLSDKVVDLPPVATASQSIYEWTAWIANQSQTVSLGSAEVYTTAEGVDLRELLRLTLLGAVLYAQATDSLLPWVDTLDNISFRSSCTCTDLEHTLDQAFGNWGAARDYRSFSDEALSSGPDATGMLPYVKDLDGDGKIDFTREYNHLFARIAAQRDLGAEGATRFRDELFDAFLEARAAAAVGPGEEATVRQQAEIILQTWDRLVAATVVHHLNEVLASMSRIGAPDYDRATHNRAWADMIGFTQMLGYNPLNQVGSAAVLQADYLNPMGNAPVYDPPGDPVHEAYVLTLSILRGNLGSRYGFSQELLEKW